MVGLREDIPACMALDSSSKSSINLSTAYNLYTRSGYTGLLTPPLASPSPSNYTHSKHGSTPPRDACDSKEVRLPPISELLKLVPSPAIQLPAPRRLSSWSSDYTPRPSPTCVSSPQSFHSALSSENSRAQFPPLPPIVQGRDQCPSPPPSHWTHLPPRTNSDASPPRKRGRGNDGEDRGPSPPLKRRRTNAYREDHRPSLPLKRRRGEYRENVRRNSTPTFWVQQEAPPVLVSSPDAQDEDFWARYSRRQSAHYLYTQASTSQALVPRCDRSIAPPAKKKKENTPYTQEQEFFIRYFVVDLGYSWEVVQEHYMSWFPAVHRTVGALTCEYYRTNKQIPVLEDGLLVLGLPRHPDEQLSKREYRGFRFVCKEQQCRKDKINPLLAIFPEEYEDPGNRWILPEHRGKGAEAAQRLQEQRAKESRRYKAKL